MPGPIKEFVEEFRHMLAAFGDYLLLLRLLSPWEAFCFRDQLRNVEGLGVGVRSLLGLPSFTEASLEKGML